MIEKLLLIYLCSVQGHITPSIPCTEESSDICTREVPPVPEVGCPPPPNDDCYYSMDLECFNACKDDYEAQLEQTKMVLCNLYGKLVARRERVKGWAREHYLECLRDRMPPNTCSLAYSNELEFICYSFNEAIRALEETWDEAVQNATEDFIGCAMDCCILICD